MPFVYEAPATMTIRVVRPAVRLLLGALGASLVTIPPLWIRFSTRLESNFAEIVVNFAEIETVVTGVAVVLSMVWVTSVLLVWFEEHTHPTVCVISGMGLPGLFLSIAIGFQAVT